MIDLYNRFQCCGSGMFIPDPGSGMFIPDPRSGLLSIPDPGLSLRSQKHAWFRIQDPRSCIWEIREKLIPDSGWIRIRNTGRFSGLRDPVKTYSGSWIQGTGSRIRIRNTGSFLRTDGRDAVGPAEAVRAARHEAADLRHVQVHLHPLAPRHVLPAGPRDLALLYTGTALFTTLSSCSIYPAVRTTWDKDSLGRNPFLSFKLIIMGPD